MKTIIIDDEPLALESLEYDLNKYCSDIDIIGKYLCPIKAKVGINKLKPDIVITDIEMPYMNAFTMLNDLKYKSFDLIFLTAYDEFALKAFELSAVDYLVKPLDPNKLKIAIDKVKEKQYTTDIEEKLSLIMHNMRFGTSDHFTLAVPTMDGAEFIEIKDILYLKADANYCHIILKDESKITVSKPLKHFTDILENHLFIRIHQSYLANMKYIKKYLKGTTGNIILKNGDVLPISRTYKKSVIDFINGQY